VYLYVAFAAEQYDVFRQGVAANYYRDDVMILAFVSINDIVSIKRFVTAAACPFVTIIYLLRYPLPGSQYSWPLAAVTAVPGID
jgi:hypothetical protein